MCFILGFYYRDDGDTEPVVGGGCLSSKDGLLCPLAPAVTTRDVQATFAARTSARHARASRW